MAVIYNETLDCVVGKSTINTKYKTMNCSSYSKTVPMAYREQEEANGWYVVRENKTTYRMAKDKDPATVFVSKIWTMLADMGFLYLCREPDQFQLPISSSESRYIDIFGIDEDVVVVAECRTADEPGTHRNFSEDIDIISEYSSRVPQQLQKCFSGKPKYIFMLCTCNYIVSEEDRQKMQNANIVWFDENRVDYYKMLVKDLGVLAKYQFLGEVLEGKEIPGMESMRVPAIKAKMGPYDCYSLMVEPKKLLKICFVLHRTDDLNNTNTYQRYVKKSRIESIKKYVQDGGFFPNSIIINFDNTRINFEPAGNKVQSSSKCTIGNVILPAKYKSAFIIDGQHRLYGYAGTEEQNRELIPVIAFEKLPPEEQTRMFVDINNKAVSVKRNLLESLNGELYWNSPNKKMALHALRSMLAINLNKTTTSPLYDCIQIGEKANKTNAKKMTLTYFIDVALAKSQFFVKEWQRNNEPSKLGPLYGGDLSDGSLKKSYDVFTYYFGMIKDRCPEQWESLLTNLGLSTLILMLSEFLAERQEEYDFSNCDSEKIINVINNRVVQLCNSLSNKTQEEIQRYTRYLGYGGINESRRHFEKMVHVQDSSFTTEGLEEWIVQDSGAYTEKTNVLLSEMVPWLISTTENTLKELFDDNYMIELPSSVLTAVQKRLQKDRDREHFLELKDLQDVITYQWKDKLEPVLGYNCKGGKNQRTEYLKTLLTISNAIDKGKEVSEAQYHKVEDIYIWFKAKQGELTEQN